MCERQPKTVPVTAADQLAGFLVRDSTRFRFLAADSRFGLLDGSRFSRLPDAQRAVERLARVVQGEGGSAHRRCS